MKYKKLLQNKLIEFQNFNPTFGRKIVKYVNIMSQQKILRKTVETFNSKHIVFHDKNKEKKTFMESHNLKYKEDSNVFDLKIIGNVDIDQIIDQTISSFLAGSKEIVPDWVKRSETQSQSLSKII
jgi:hypothetical protein